MSKFAVLIKPWSVMVKAWYFFVDQGGAKEPWGKDWVQVEAHDLEAARRKGELARDLKPGPCEPAWPNRGRRKNHLIRSWSTGGLCFFCGKLFPYKEQEIKRALKVSRRRHNFKAAAARNAKAFASTKSRDGQYPI